MSTQSKSNNNILDHFKKVSLVPGLPPFELFMAGYLLAYDEFVQQRIQISQGNVSKAKELYKKQMNDLREIGGLEVKTNEAR